MGEFNAENFIQHLSARELSELKALLNSDEYTDMIDRWEESMDDNQHDD